MIIFNVYIDCTKYPSSNIWRWLVAAEINKAYNKITHQFSNKTLLQQNAFSSKTHQFLELKGFNREEDEYTYLLSSKNEKGMFHLHERVILLQERLSIFKEECKTRANLNFFEKGQNGKLPLQYRLHA